MSDRDLLEKAAKAAGHQLVWGDKWDLGGDLVDLTDMAYIRSGRPDESDVYWDPLEDDGDALRLAVKLRIDLIFAADATWVRCRVDQFASYHHHEPHGDDPYAATRRAIVRAAASLGEQYD